MIGDQVDMLKPPDGHSLFNYWTRSRLDALHAVLNHLLDGQNIQAPVGSGLRVSRPQRGQISLIANRSQRGGGSNVVYPWTPKQGSSAHKVTVKTGVVNGSVFATNANTELTLAADSTNYCYLEASLTNGVITGCEMKIASSVPTAADPAANNYPSKAYHALFRLDTTADAIDWSTLEQYAHRSLTLITYVHDVSGTAPDYDVEYFTAWIS